MPDYRAVARQKAKKYGINDDLFVRQIGAESNFNPNAGSPAGARGIAQIMPATAASWGVDPSDPVASLDAAAKNMARYINQYGNWRDALTAYNAGPGRVGKPLYRETRAYISKILAGTNPTAAASTAVGTPDPQRPNRIETTPSVTAGGVDKEAAITDALLSRRNKIGDGKLGPGLLQDASARVSSGAYGLPRSTPARVPHAAEHRHERNTPAAGTARSTPRGIVDQEILPMARQLGFQISSSSVAEANHRHGPTVSGGRSDHQGDGRNSWAADISNGTRPTKEMDRLAASIAKKYGIPWKGSGAVSVTRGGFRYQLIYRSNVGGNHHNHIHIGIARAR